MKTLIIASLLAASSTFAFASSGNSETWEPAAASTGSTLTRAQVINELHEAQSNNQLAYGELVPQLDAAPASALKRAQVRAELNAYLGAGHRPLHGNLDYRQR